MATVAVWRVFGSLGIPPELCSLLVTCSGALFLFFVGACGGVCDDVGGVVRLPAGDRFTREYQFCCATYAYNHCVPFRGNV